MTKLINFEKDRDEYEVWCKGERLGQIVNENVWRKKRWIFYPLDETFYSHECLIEIAEFCIKLEVK